MLQIACLSNHGFPVRFVTLSWRELLAHLKATGQLIKALDGQVKKFSIDDYSTTTDFYLRSRGLCLDFCHLFRIQLVKISAYKFD
jgi:hypothetical protein